MSNDMLTHNRLDSFFTEALMKNKPDWDMETVRTAALICSNALLLNSGYPRDITSSKWVDEFLDELGRDVAVMGLHNHGFGVSVQKYLARKAQILTAYIEQSKSSPDEAQGEL